MRLLSLPQHSIWRFDVQGGGCWLQESQLALAASANSISSIPSYSARAWTSPSRDQRPCLRGEGQRGLGCFTEQTRAETGSDVLPRSVSARQRPARQHRGQGLFPRLLLFFFYPGFWNTGNIPVILPAGYVGWVLCWVSFQSSVWGWSYFSWFPTLVRSDFCLAQEIRHCQVTGHPAPIQWSGLTFVLLHDHYQCCSLAWCQSEKNNQPASPNPTLWKDVCF